MGDTPGVGEGCLYARNAAGQLIAQLDDDGEILPGALINVTKRSLSAAWTSGKRSMCRRNTTSRAIGRCWAPFPESPTAARYRQFSTKGNLSCPIAEPTQLDVGCSRQ